MGIREEFEKLPEIAEIIVREKAVFIGDGYRIRGNDQAESYLDGAWYTFQEQQKKKDLAISKIKAFEKNTSADQVLFLNDLLIELKGMLK